MFKVVIFISIIILFSCKTVSLSERLNNEVIGSGRSFVSSNIENVKETKAKEEIKPQRPIEIRVIKDTVLEKEQKSERPPVSLKNSETVLKEPVVQKQEENLSLTKAELLKEKITHKKISGFESLNTLLSAETDLKFIFFPESLGNKIYYLNITYKDKEDLLKQLEQQTGLFIEHLSNRKIQISETHMKIYDISFVESYISKNIKNLLNHKESSAIIDEDTSILKVNDDEVGHKRISEYIEKLKNINALYTYNVEVKNKGKEEFSFGGTVSPLFQNNFEGGGFIRLIRKGDSVAVELNHHSYPQPVVGIVPSSGGEISANYGNKSIVLRIKNAKR